ncbi:MAG: NAD-dependent epimerase/dehydratase family protein, partial [Pseudomonadota bacterium]|nr:NAD-dependent epimerase/dehydratase family protein [Pseudomonadota bacterium]
MNKLLVVGATGLLGKATIKFFKNKKDWKCAGLSRRPHKIRNVEYLRGDLLDKGSIDRLQSRL